jgi:uncharacterized protein
MTRSIKYLTIFIFVFILSFSSFAYVKFPSPKGFVNDFVGILSSQEKQELESISASLRQKTGAELAIAIVKTVEPLDSKLYAVKLFENWGIGEKGKDNGVLLLVALEERRVEIEVGYGLEGVLTDARAGSILDDYAVPNFKQGKMGEGIIQSAKALSQVIAKEEVTVPVTAKARVEKEDHFVPLVVVIVIIVILGIILRRTGSIIMGFLGAFWGSEYGGLVGAIIGGLIGFFFGFWGLFFFGRGGGVGRGAGGGGFGGFGGGRSGGGGAGRGW